MQRESSLIVVIENRKKFFLLFIPIEETIEKNIKRSIKIKSIVGFIVNNYGDS